MDNFYNERHRHPRVFYGEEHYYKVYSENDARLKKGLRKQKIFGEKIITVEQVNEWNDDLFICNTGLILQS